MLNETISIYAIIDELLKAMPAAGYAYAHQEDLGLIDCSSVRSHPHMEIWRNSVDEATCNPGCDRHPTSELYKQLQTLNAELEHRVQQRTQEFVFNVRGRIGIVSTRVGIVKERIGIVSTRVGIGGYCQI